MADTVAITDLEGGVRLITLNRPEKKNALTGAMYDAMRAALAEAAIRLAARHGAENVTVEAISAEAGVSARTFFNYFDSRDDAFLTVDADFGPRVRRLVLDAPAALPPLRAVREALAAELAPRASMMAAPRLATVGMKVSLSHASSTCSAALVLPICVV